MIFAVSFVVLFSLFQFLMGLFLTFIYTPDMELAWSASATLSHKVVLKGDSFFFTFFFAFLSATIAYFIPQKLNIDHNK
ncbi:hypothetical protein [Paracerasibacillus soli]|uniref:Uncharacterized protein n=2 Tax=Paracerasibacillus soli TaxID=480284 RepID=A0ABU5CVJ7_9BACI|nr:hypothetical protein [Virgibacillus soli]MDY0410406.1 hypothetical protein [Virgibacillus soli]